MSDKLQAVESTGLVPIVALRGTGPYAKGETFGVDPKKARELLTAAPNSFAKAKAKGDVKMIDVDDEPLPGAHEPALELAEALQEKYDAEKALSETNAELSALREQLAGRAGVGTTALTDEQEIEQMRATLKAAGESVDARWGKDTLKEKVDALAAENTA